MSLSSVLSVGPAVPSLIRWGLSADADLSYRALLGNGPRTVRELGSELGFGPRRAGTAIDELAACSLASGTGGGGRRAAESRWTVCPAPVAVAVLRRRRYADTDPWAQARRHLAAVADLRLPEHPEATGERIRRIGLHQIRSRIRDLVAAERYEHLAMQPERVFTADAVAAALPLDRQLVSRGVRMKIIGRPPEDGDRYSPASQALSGMGGDYRETDDIPLKMMIFDRRVLLVPAGPNDSSGVLEIADCSVVEAAVAMFTRGFLQALDPRKKGVRSIMLTPRERAIVEALSRGLTDEQVADELKLSPRTIGYALRGLMDQLKVDNRFQLGLVLGAASATPIPGEDTNPPDGGVVR